MANDYSKMAADLIARMSRPRETAMCAACHASIAAADHSARCGDCSADDTLDDLDLEALTRPIRRNLGEVAHG